MPHASSDKFLLTQLTTLLKGGQAHVPFEDAVKSLPAKLRGQVPAGLPYSAWQIVEHIRIAQRDILDFSRNVDSKGKSPYKPMHWPDDYWPKSPAPPNAKAWTNSIRHIHADRAAFIQILRAATPSAAANSEALHTRFPWAKEGQTLLREALLIADHTSYHTGELIVLRRLLTVLE